MNGARAPLDAARYCAELVRTHDFERYASSLFMPAAQRRALLALYAFNVEICRIPDQVSQPLPGEIRLQWWTDMLAGQGHGGIEGNPVAAELRHAIAEFTLEAEPLTGLIEEHIFDLYNDPMPTLAALEHYLARTSGALFAAAAAIAGARVDDLNHLAHHAGLAQGMVQMVASLGHDASKGRLFVPAEVLQRHGVGAGDVLAGKNLPELRPALNELLGEAERHLGIARSLLADIPSAARPVFLPLANVRRDLARLLRAKGTPFVAQPASRLAILWTSWRASRSREFAA